MDVPGDVEQKTKSGHKPAKSGERTIWQGTDVNKEQTKKPGARSKIFG